MLEGWNSFRLRRSCISIRPHSIRSAARNGIVCRCIFLSTLSRLAELCRLPRQRSLRDCHGIDMRCCAAYVPLLPDLRREDMHCGQLFFFGLASGGPVFIPLYLMHGLWPLISDQMSDYWSTHRVPTRGAYLQPFSSLQHMATPPTWCRSTRRRQARHSRDTKSSGNALK